MVSDVLSIYETYLDKLTTFTECHAGDPLHPRPLSFRDKEGIEHDNSVAYLDAHSSTSTKSPHGTVVPDTIEHQITG